MDWTPVDVLAVPVGGIDVYETTIGRPHGERYPWYSCYGNHEFRHAQHVRGGPLL